MSVRTRGLVIAIDGPAGAGKSTAARNLARRLGYLYLDTGATFRAIAWKAIQNTVDLANREEVERVAAESTVAFVPGAGDRVLVDGWEVTPLLRTPEISQASSRIAAYPGVRRVLLALWRDAGREGGVIVEGRDIGTVVFPDAELKLYLDASPDVRAERRYLERGETGGPTLAVVRQELERRDTADRERVHAPLTRADDAVFVDTSRLSPEETAARLERLARECVSRLTIREGKLPRRS